MISMHMSFQREWNVNMEFFTNGEIVNKKSGLSAFLHWLKNQNSFFSTVTEKLKVIITLLLF